MEQVTKNVYAETKIRGCNPGFVITSDGVVVIDTPQLPTHAVKMRKEAESHGVIRYLINTEYHVDHIIGNYYFKGAGTVISHEETFNNFMTVTPEINPYEYAYEAIPTDDPEGEKIWPDAETYWKDPNKPTIIFNKDMKLTVGDHTFELINTPGHTPGQLAVYMPEEKTVFVGDTIFNGCQTWHYASNIEEWIRSLDRIKQLDIDYIVPGHGPVCTKQALDVQKAFLMEWLFTIQSAIAKGLTKEEAIKTITFVDRFPVDIGQEYMLSHVIEHNTDVLYDKLKGK